MKVWWERAAEPWDVARLAPAEAQALRAAAQRTVEADSFGEVRGGLRVRSKRLGRRGFVEWLARMPRERTQYLLLYPRHLVFINCEGKKPPFAFAARLDQIEVRSFRSTLVEDHGVVIRGVIGGGTQRGELFVGMGQGPHADAFEAALREATPAL